MSLPPGGTPAAWGQSRPVGPPFFDDKTKEDRKPKPPATRPAATSPASAPATKPASAPATRPAPTRPAPASRPASRPALAIDWPKEDLDLRADRAIRRGLDYLYGAQKPDGSWDSRYARQHPGGVEALVLLTALSAGEDPRHPRLAAALKYVDQVEPRTVYVRAARALAYARLPGQDHADRLATDAAWLGRFQHRTGGWGYGPGYRTTRENPNWTDVSNTFLAMLALRDAEAAGAEVPANTWRRCRIYWSRAANADGGISYQPPGGTGFRLRGSSYGSMTAAGVTALLVLSDKWAALDEPDFANVSGRRANPCPYQKALDQATQWLAGNYTVRQNPKWVWGPGEAYEYYYLYCLQHVADEGGIRQLGGQDFARDAADLIASRQRPDGSWCDPQMTPDAADELIPIRTCFALLALIQARGPVVIQRLALGEGPANDPRDAANLARWIGRTLRRPASWRQVALDTPDELLRRAPILYVHTAVKQYPDALAGKLRGFVAGGGTLVVQPFGGERELFEAARDYLVGLFGDYQHGEVPDSHPVYSLHFKVPPAGRPRLFGLGDGCRTRIFLFGSDVSGAWHQDRARQYPQLFQLAANLLLYTTDLAPPTGKLRAGNSRPAPSKPLKTVKLARVRHAGDWDVCPQALRRLGEVLNEAVSIGAEEMPAVDPGKPTDHSISVLWLTGTRGPGLLASQKTGLKQYLAAGGTLFVDSAMGEKAFTQRAATMLMEMFGPESLRDLPADHPLLTGAFGGGIGTDVTKVAYTRAAAQTGGPTAPSLQCVLLNGRVAAVLSPSSVSCPLEDQPVYGCKGLSRDDAARLAANVVLYAITWPNGS